jgi:hypothetical protein
MTSRLIWDQGNADEVAAARHMFEHLTGAGHLAYKTDGDLGARGDQIHEWDPTAGDILLEPHSTGQAGVTSLWRCRNAARRHWLTSRSPGA